MAFAVAEAGEECSTSPPKTQGLPPNPGYLRGSFSSSMENDVSPKLAAWGELEFRKAFLILSYIGENQLEHVDISADEIRTLKHLGNCTITNAT
ncbi:hypothetical protein SO802_021920 [Lithocarpus litseifolius]|uniref:RDRP helical domain-containing protein n=1 Tax=Lithocarpus litseifolius TaxID=425828 RepID=A0AAW2CKJ3_9ROSI